MTIRKHGTGEVLPEQDEIQTTAARQDPEEHQAVLQEVLAEEKDEQ